MRTQTCIAPITDTALCGATATDTRTLEGLLCALCPAHAADVDAERGRSYSIASAVSGADLGTYPGETPAEALDAMARDAGYADHAAACVASGDDGAHLRVTEVPA